jgi:two-component system, OmpR family, KDP operon response regulator KdpE
MMENRKKILIVDDEERLLRILSIKFKISGYDTITAPGGGKALELIKNEKPDVVLLDIIMPGVDGFQVLEELRKFSDMPVIAFSARPENGPKAIKAGATDFVPKPFDVEKLTEKVEQVLENK